MKLHNVLIIGLLLVILVLVSNNATRYYVVSDSRHIITSTNVPGALGLDGSKFGVNFQHQWYFIADRTTNLIIATNIPGALGVTASSIYF